jgi:hypothetical protein
MERHLGDPGHRALPIVLVARQAAAGNGVAHGQVGWAAVLVVVAAGRLLHKPAHHRSQPLFSR